jgi:pimeloyl-ACP methyl ester carboxylesterase
MKVKEGFVESGGHKLAYLAVNEHLASDEEPAIVFIHGVLASVNFWLDCVPPEFKEGRAWYSLSLPAHHPSTVPQSFKLGDVDEAWFFNIMNGALQELLGEKKAIVVGHSTGGFCALNIAIHQASNVLGIVSVAGFHRGKWGGVEGLLLKIAGLGKWAKSLFVSNILISQWSYFVRRTFAGLLAYNRKAYRSNPLSQLMLENIEANTLAQDPVALFILFNGIADLEIADQLYRIDMPCYIFSGTHDPVVPEEQSQVLGSKVSGAKSVVFDNVGHMPFIEDSDSYFKALELALKDITDNLRINTSIKKGND